ncbi:MAG: hypothetical protein ACE5FU_11710 [Nitrospinota bacterium]
MFDFSKMMGGTQNTKNTFELSWSNEAKVRLERVPAGFMRNMTAKKIETAAKAQNLESVSLDFVEKELADSASLMQSMMGKTKKNSGQEGFPATSREDTVAPKTYYCEICGFTMQVPVEKRCPNCKSGSEKVVQIKDNEKERQVSKTSGQILTWDEAALKKLSEIPAGFMQDLTKWRVERFSRSNALSLVTEKVFSEKFNQWEKSSTGYGVELPWEKEALSKVEKIPSFIRGIVQKEVERVARSKGATSVTEEMLFEIKGMWNSGMKFHG